MRALLRKLGTIAAEELARAGAAKVAEAIVEAAVKRIAARRAPGGNHGEAKQANPADRGN